MANHLIVTEQCFAIKFIQKEGETAANAYVRLANVYGEHCMSRARVFAWFKTPIDFKAGICNLVP